MFRQLLLCTSITRGVSVSHLVDNGCFIMNHGILVLNAISCNGIYEIDIPDISPNVNSMYTVSIEPSMTCTLPIFGTFVLRTLARIALKDFNVKGS